MKISIVTISFNQAQFLENAILSVLNQNYPDVEYIVVDPGSTDGSRDIIEKYRGRIQHVVYEKDSGPADGLNKGFALATGDIFCFINSDDYLLPNCISIIASYFESKPQTDVVLAGGLRVDGNGNIDGAYYPSLISAKRLVNGAVTFFQQGMFFSATLFQKVGGFNVENQTCWDGELLLAFILSGAKFGRLMTKVAAFRIYPLSITGSQKYAMQFKADQRRLYKLVYGPGCEPQLMPKLIYRTIKLLGDPIYVYKRCIG